MHFSEVRKIKIEFLNSHIPQITNMALRGHKELELIEVALTFVSEAGKFPIYVCSGANSQLSNEKGLEALNYLLYLWGA